MAHREPPSDREKRLSDFREMCSTSEQVALEYLETHDWNVDVACNSYFLDEDERAEAAPDSAPQAPSSEAPYTGPRTLDGRPAPQAYRRPPATTAAQPKKKGIATLGSLAPGSSHGDGEDDEDDDDDDGDDDGRGNLFAGGEKSGLAVQDPQRDGPKSIINDIVSKAKANASRADGPSNAGPSRPTAASRFRGTGMTLGGEGVESRAIPDPLGPTRSANSEPQERILHIWQDGFSIGDGELRRFSDPANQADLMMIRSGRAPLHLMDVQHDQPVDVKLHQHEGPYRPPPKTLKPFSGTGHRLGSPVPGGASSAASTSSSAAPASASTTAAAVAAATSSSAATSSGPAVDASQPTVSLRIQLPDGTRLPARFNLTSTVGDVYAFVQDASSETRSRAWVLSTTFPNKEHADKSLVLGDVPEFKKGGTAVVKWT